MRFIQKWSYSCAYQLTRQLHESHAKRGVYYYGFQVIIGAIVKVALLIAVTLLTGSLIPVLLIVLVFGSLRMLAGGYHMDTYGTCIFTSMVLFVVASIIDQYTYKYWDTVGLAILTVGAFLFSLALSIRYAPNDNPNRPITKPEEIKKFKRLTIVYEVILFAVSVGMVILGYKMAAIAVSFGMVLEIFTITPVGHKFFDWVKVKLKSILK